MTRRYVPPADTRYIVVTEPFELPRIKKRRARRTGVAGRQVHLEVERGNGVIAPDGSRVTRTRLLDIGCEKAPTKGGYRMQPAILAHVEDIVDGAHAPMHRRFVPSAGPSGYEFEFLPSGAFGYHVRGGVPVEERADGGEFGDFVVLTGGIVMPCAVTASNAHHLDAAKILACIDLTRPDGPRRRRPVDVSRVVVTG